GFADDGGHLTGSDGEVAVGHGRTAASAGVDDGESVAAQQRRARQDVTFRRVLPSWWVASTMAMTTRPGSTVSHQAVATKLRPSAMMRPHSGVGGGVP